MTSPERHHRREGSLARGPWKGQIHERWQYEVTDGGRIWHLVDDERPYRPDHLRWLRPPDGNGLTGERTSRSG